MLSFLGSASASLYEGADLSGGIPPPTPASIFSSWEARLKLREAALPSSSSSRLPSEPPQPASAGWGEKLRKRLGKAAPVNLKPHFASASKRSSRRREQRGGRWGSAEAQGP